MAANIRSLPVRLDGPKAAKALFLLSWRAGFGAEVSWFKKLTSRALVVDCWFRLGYHWLRA